MTRTPGPAPVAAIPSLTLDEEAERAADLGHWSAGKEYVTELLRRTPGDEALLARQAELCYRAGDLAGAVAAYADLECRDAIRPDQAERWIECLGRLGARQQLTHTLRRLVDRFVDDPGFLAFAADAFWELADLPVLDGKDREVDLVRVAWATLLCAVLPGAASDDQGVAFIRRLEMIWESGQGVEPPIGYYDEYETALAKFAEAGPRAALAAANLLTSSNPALALEVAARTDDGLGQVLVCASAHCELGEYDRAAVLFDRLENLWGHSALDLHLDDRFAWVQAMAEVGRFAEADEVCRVTLERVHQRRSAARAGVITLGAEGLDDDHTGHWAHVYEVMAGRLAQLQGRFAQGWDHFRAASDDDNESRELRRSALRLRLIQSGRTLAARALRDLEELAQSEKTDAAMLSFVEGSLWAATQWGSETPLALVERGDETERYFSGARLRGQVAARALLARSGDELELGQRLRLLLLAGDDRTAERLLAAHTLTDADPWSVWVLAAVLALRTGLDARASDLLDQVLVRRPHDIDLRILHAQAELFRGDYRSALVEAIACTDAMPNHVVARVVKAECEFETSLARKNAESSDGDGQSAENAQQLILAVSDYRRAADLHISTREYLETGSSSGAVGSEPLSPRLFQEVCRRGMHAAILAQEELDRLGLRGDRQLMRDAAALLQHLRRAGHRCCQALAGRPGRGLLHRLKHLGDRDEPSRLGWLLASHRIHTWTTRAQNVLLISMGVAVCWVGLTDLLPGPESEAIRATVFALGILLALMPFARSLKIGVVELQRAEAARPVFGRSKALRTSSLMQRGYHLGSFALPATPEMGRSKREIVEADLGDGSGPASNPGIAALVTTPTPAG